MRKVFLIPIPIYLINLERSTERLEHFSHQARTEGLEFIRISAVDGDDLDDDVRAFLSKIRRGNLHLGPREMGCFLSHRKVWKRFLADGLDWGFVAEDDIHFCNASQFFINIDWLPPEAKVIKAETSRHRIHLHKKVNSKPFGHELRRLLSYHEGAGGYFLSKSGAEILLEKTMSRCAPVDLLMFHEDFELTKSLRILQLDPAICIQDRLLAGAGNFASLIDVDRRKGKRKYKDVQGLLEKLCLELSRSIRFASNFIRDFIKTLFAKALIKKVKFAGDRLSFIKLIIPIRRH